MREYLSFFFSLFIAWNNTKEIPDCLKWKKQQQQQPPPPKKSQNKTILGQKCQNEPL